MDFDFKGIEALTCSSQKSDALDRALRAAERAMVPSLLPQIIEVAREVGLPFFDPFIPPCFSSIKEAIHFRYLYVPILYKLGMTCEAAGLAQRTFEYLFPQLQEETEMQIKRLFGKNYRQECAGIVQFYLCQDTKIASSHYRIKSPHSIWKRMKDLDTFKKLSLKDFASHITDLIGVRYAMQISENQRADALVEGITLAPLKNLRGFRNQCLLQSGLFEREPVIKLKYVQEGISIELQIFGGNITNYICAKGYAIYKTALPFPPRKEEMAEDLWNRRLNMALQADTNFRKWMYAELIGERVDYSQFQPFHLETCPVNSRNQLLRFSASPLPLHQLAHLNFDESPQLLTT